MIDDKNAKQILNEPSSFFVSTISKKSKIKPSKGVKEESHPNTP